MNSSAPMNRLRERLARREVEKTSVIASIALPSTSAVQIKRAMSRYVDLVQEIREIVAELSTSAAETTALPSPGAPTKPHHRLNCDGTIDSICIRCFAAIACSRRVEDLERAERAHICNPEALRRYYRRRPT